MSERYEAVSLLKKDHSVAVIESFFSHLKTEYSHLFPVDSAGQVNR